MARNAEVTTVTRSQNKNLKNVTPMGELIRGKLNMSHEPEGQSIYEFISIMKKKREKEKKNLAQNT